MFIVYDLGSIERTGGDETLYFKLLDYLNFTMMRSLQTVAALTCMKTLVMIFNVLFWVSFFKHFSFGCWH